MRREQASAGRRGLGQRQHQVSDNQGQERGAAGLRLRILAPRPGIDADLPLRKSASVLAAKAVRARPRLARLGIAVVSGCRPHWSGIEVRFAGLHVGEPPWATQGDMIFVARGSAVVAWGPLLLGRIAMQDLELQGARLQLIRLADGRTNWPVGGAGCEPAWKIDPHLGDIGVGKGVIRPATIERSAVTPPAEAPITTIEGDAMRT